MIIYIEKKIRGSAPTKKIVSHFKDAQILEIDNYKNIFDKNIAGKIEKSIIIASVNNAILEAPVGYGFEGAGYFLKNSLNCVYDCSYCYLKGAFKNDTQVYFINFDDIQKQIKQTLKKHTSKEKIWFYSSDYSDNLATNGFTGFCETFIPFFETLPNVMMEIRTKSVNIQTLLKFKSIKHTEIAFSLNPEEIVSKYEKNTPSLDMRIKAVNTLIDSGWLVGIRFLPLLEINNYQEIYTNFLEYVTKKIDFTKVHSVFIGGLMFTHDDYNRILKKDPYLDVLYRLEKNNDGIVREKKEVREWFYKKFGEYITQKKCNICLDGEFN